MRPGCRSSAKPWVLPSGARCLRRDLLRAAAGRGGEDVALPNFGRPRRGTYPVLGAGLGTGAARGEGSESAGGIWGLGNLLSYNAVGWCSSLPPARTAVTPHTASGAELWGVFFLLAVRTSHREALRFPATFWQLLAVCLLIAQLGCA